MLSSFWISRLSWEPVGYAFRKRDDFCVVLYFPPTERCYSSLRGMFQSSLIGIKAKVSKDTKRSRQLREVLVAALNGWQARYWLWSIICGPINSPNHWMSRQGLFENGNKIVLYPSSKSDELYCLIQSRFSLHWNGSKERSQPDELRKQKAHGSMRPRDHRSCWIWTKEWIDWPSIKEWVKEGSSSKP